MVQAPLSLIIVFSEYYWVPTFSPKTFWLTMCFVVGYVWIKSALSRDFLALCLSVYLEDCTDFEVEPDRRVGYLYSNYIVSIVLVASYYTYISVTSFPEMHFKMIISVKSEESSVLELLDFVFILPISLKFSNAVVTKIYFLKKMTVNICYYFF